MNMYILYMCVCIQINIWKQNKMIINVRKEKRQIQSYYKYSNVVFLIN